MATNKAHMLLPGLLPLALLLSCVNYPVEIDYQDKVELQAHVGKVLSVAFSPDGRHLASGGTDGVAKIWDVENESLLYNLPSGSAEIYSVAFSPNGKLLASGSFNQIQLWSTATGELVRNITGHPDAIYSIAFNPDGDQLASAGPDPNLRLWDLRNPFSEDPAHIVTGHQGAIYMVRYSADGRYVVSASFDKTVRMSDSRTGLPAKYFRGHEAAVFAALFDNTGDQIISTGNDSTIRVWDVKTTKELKKVKIHQMEEHDIPEQVWAMVSIPQIENIVAIGGREGFLRFWNVRTRRRKREIRLRYGDIWDLAVSSTGDRLAVACADGVILTYTLNK